ncbi:MAG: hypothetical protein LH473_05200 [Chitinophagales bacterium]|nr:hypothetical protein [Chitinophagales bacterium]
MKTLTLIFTFTLILSFTAIKAQQIVGALDGKSFAIELMKDGKLDSKETLVFEKGMVDPLDCHQYGFTSTAYQAKNAAGMSTWAAYCKSDKEGTMSWQGKVTGDRIEGTVVWSKDGQSRINYTYSGVLIKPAVK